MITPEFAKQFAADWVAAWNSRNLDTILSHYTEDFTIYTPLAANIVPDSKGKLSGKEAIRAYWTIGLERQPNLKFEIIDVLTGVDGITIYYINGRGKKVVEAFWLNKDGLVYKTCVFYAE